MKLQKLYLFKVPVGKKLHFNYMKTTGLDLLQEKEKLN